MDMTLTVKQMTAVLALSSSLVILSAILALRIHNLDVLVWLEFIAVLGPVGSLFLIGILGATFASSNRTDRIAFALGVLSGASSFLAWLIVPSKIF